MYVIVRSDLEKPQITVQAVHSGIVGGQAFKPPHNHYLVVCTVKNEEHLRKVMSILNVANIKYIEFKEPDIDNQSTAICSDIVFGDQRKIFKKYRLFK